MAAFKNRNIFLETELRDTSPDNSRIFHEETPAQRRAQMAATRAATRAVDDAVAAEAKGFFPIPKLSERARLSNGRVTVVPPSHPGLKTPEDAAAVARSRSLADSLADQQAAIEATRISDAWPQRVRKGGGGSNDDEGDDESHHGGDDNGGAETDDNDD